MQHQGKLLGIALREASRSPMLELERVEVSAAHGLAGDFRGKPGDRQVTVLSVADWNKACAELQQDSPWTVRRANLLVDGLKLAESTGGRLKIGQVVLRITRETTPCDRMDEQVDGLKQALGPDWRGGVCCCVEVGGILTTGDEVTFEPAH